MVTTRSAASTPATAALTKAGMPFTVHLYQFDAGAPSYGLEAAAALGVPVEQVLKTLLVRGEHGLGVGIVPVHLRLDLKAVAAALGAKRVSMANRRDAERSSGYAVGGISPIGMRTALPTVLDSSAEAVGLVYVSGGRRGMDISLSPADLVAVTTGRTAAIAG